MIVLDMSIADSHEVANAIQTLLKFCCCEELQSFICPFLSNISLRLEAHAPLQSVGLAIGLFG